MNRSHRVGLPAVAATAAVALVLSACGSSGGSSSGGKSSALTASAPGITATTITIGSHQPLTGVAAPGYDEIAPASNAYFAYSTRTAGWTGGRSSTSTSTTSTTRPTPCPWSSSSCCRTTCTRSSMGWARPPTWRWRRSSTRRRCRTCSWPPAVSAGMPRPPCRRRSAGSWTTYARARSSASTSSSTSPGKKIGYFYQDDEFGKDGVKGLDHGDPARRRGQPGELRPDQHQRRPPGGGAQGSGAKVVVSFTVPAFTALLKLNSLKLGFNPTSRRQ